MYKTILAFTSLVVSLTGHAALYDRGNGMIYDDVLDITWLQDANYAYTSGYTLANMADYGYPSPIGIRPDGRMGWEAANTWAEQLVYGGYDDWRLASARLQTPVDYTFSYDGSSDEGYNNTSSELGHMFFNNLGNAGRFDSSGNLLSGFGLSNTSFTDASDGETVTFFNLYSNAYWAGEEFTSDTLYAWVFDTYFGAQVHFIKGSSQYAWAVRDGDVAAVPVPAAVWLFGSALICLAGFRRKS